MIGQPYKKKLLTSGESRSTGIVLASCRNGSTPFTYRQVARLLRHSRCKGFPSWPFREAAQQGTPAMKARSRKLLLRIANG